MKHLEVRQKYSPARSIFNSLLSISSGDETLRLKLDILLKRWPAWQAFETGGKRGFVRERNALPWRALRVSVAPKTPFPFPFKRLPRRLQEQLTMRL